MFGLLCEKAKNYPKGRLPIHVRCILDEFANLGKIPNFEVLVSVIRSREISVAPILQTKSQINTNSKQRPTNTREKDI
jgi:type IV secretion system protein VirD4